MGRKMVNIKQVLRTSEYYKVVIYFENGKEVNRKLKNSVNDGSLYFVYKKREYYINRLNMLNIELVEY